MMGILYTSRSDMTQDRLAVFQRALSTWPDPGLPFGATCNGASFVNPRDSAITFANRVPSPTETEKKVSTANHHFVDDDFRKSGN